MEQMPAVAVRRLSVSFFGRAVIRDVELSLPGGGISVLVGRSGCGKTTLLRALNRLNGEFPGCRTTGQVELFLRGGRHVVYPGGDQPPLELRELRRRVGMVFQTPQVFPTSVYRNMALPLQTVADCPGTELDGRIEAALRQVDLWREVHDRLQTPAERLSGGQQQRLCLARALTLEPELLLLDEPTASLDVHAARHVEELLLRLVEHYPIVMVSHSLSQSLRLASTLLIMGTGGTSPRACTPEGLDERTLEALLQETKEDAPCVTR
ncbi:phosphate ABC transporter ATP-binding protein [uncultured Mailhella sp.]|uniref:phosphate ABC transporter ATP-binding protein n=1 Tax=uncultured Mailhella sp. TaxID=1981031 RepID=UPI0026244491|nr:phosphate ABC transporter ATP-binding protein [uncultured Mailhella sp.]